jgi:hypothetical protein
LNPGPQVIRCKATTCLVVVLWMTHASSDKLGRVPSPVCLSATSWRKQSRAEISNVALTGRARSPQPSMGYNLGSQSVIVADYKLHVFNEVLMRPDMLLTLQHPRRSQYAPEVRNDV